MTLDEFTVYVRDINKIFQQCQNTEVLLKGFYCITIASVYKLLLEDSTATAEEVTFGTLATGLKSIGEKPSTNLLTMFSVRNDIAHTNDIMRALIVIDTISIQDYIQEIERVIKTINLKSRYFNKEINVKQTIPYSKALNYLKSKDSLEKEVAATSDIIPITKEQLNKIKEYLPTAVYSEIFDS